MSVGSLIASPLAKGLFQRAILESGTGVGIGVSRQETARAASLKLADSLGVHGTGADAAAQLRAADAQKILNGALRLGNPGDPQFFPVVDGWVLPHPVDSTLYSGGPNIVP